MSKERFDKARLPQEKGKPESRPSRLLAYELADLGATKARSPSLFGIRLPGYRLPLLFHKHLTVHRFLEASVRSSARAHRMAASALTNAPNLNAASHDAIFGPGKGMRRDAKRLNTCSRTSDVANGLLRVRGACKRERGDGGWKKTICGHQTSSPASTSSSVGA